MIAWTLIATGLSLFCILALCVGDPKRVRSGGLGGQTASVRKRRGLTLIALLPGIALAWSGDAPAFLVWLGACAVTGWFSTMWLSRPRARRV